MGFIQNTFELSLVFGDLHNAYCKFLAKSIALLKFAKEAQKYSLAIKSFCYNCLNLRYSVPHKPFLTLMNRPKYLETPENNSKLSLLPTMNLLKVHSTNRPPFHSTHEAETSLPCTAHTGCSGKIVFFHSSLQPLPRLHIAARDLQNSQRSASVQSLLWAGLFCTTNSRRVLARERWQTFDNYWEKTQYLMNPP